MPVSGPPVSLTQAGAEMGISGAVSLLQLLRSPGGITPNTAPNAAVPQAAPIALTNLAGAQGSGSFAASKSGNANGAVFRNEPAPITLTVNSNSVTVTATGGSGSYAYNWAFVSGDSGIAINGGTSGASKSWSKTMSKNSETSAVWRCTVTDGVSTPINIDVLVSLSYTTDI